MGLEFRSAGIEDLEHLVALLANDPLGKTREDPSSPVNASYIAAFNSIDKDPGNQLIVGELDGRMLGMLQLTYIPYLSHMGSWRCLIENVRVHESFRGCGYGERLIQYAVDAARQRGCKLIQLTSDKSRVKALRFYEKLGFKATHEGFKLSLAHSN